MNIQQKQNDKIFLEGLYIIWTKLVYGLVLVLQDADV